MDGVKSADEVQADIQANEARQREIAASAAAGTAAAVTAAPATPISALDPNHGEVRQEDSQEAAAKAAETVTMVFPYRIVLTVTHLRQIVFDQGVQEVPVDVADHPYLKANGVKRYEKK